MNSRLSPAFVEERLADSAITAAIERCFATKKGVISHNLDVETQAGIVKLTGLTDSLLSRERAEEIAKAVRGVRGVINEVGIRTPAVTDIDLQRDVEQALEQDATTTDYNVRCLVHDGQVKLEGCVQSWAEEQLVLRVVKSVRGVRHLLDCLNVRPGEELLNSDAEITRQIQAFLDWDIQVQSRLITVRTTQRVVHLTGTVGTAAERDRVVTLAHVAGATRVDARDLFVAYWAHDPDLRRDLNVPKPDEHILRAVQDALTFDPRVRGVELSVHVHEGVVTLAGTVSNLRARLAAEHDADNVLGVLEVHNLLLVRSQYPSPDAMIQVNVKSALARDPFVDSYALQVNVQHGRVQLYGTVNSPFDQERAAEVAMSITGVVELQNHLQLAGNAPFPTSPGFVPPPLTAQELDKAEDAVLMQRLRNHYYWSALLHDQDIVIKVIAGRVTLTGTVATKIERQHAVAEAYACGARAVNNHLHLAAAAR